LNILVTGGAGFIGSHTVDLLISKGYNVKILDSLEKPVHLKGKPDYINPKAEFILGNVYNKTDMFKALKNIDGVIHLAAYQDYLPDFSKYFQVNSVGTSLLYELIVEHKLPIKKIIIASSQSVYGEGKYNCKNHGIIFPNIRNLNDLLKGIWDIKCPKCNEILEQQITNEEIVNPQNQYAISKYSQELIGINLGRRYNIPTVCMRYSIVQGPRQSFYNAYSGACRIFSLNLYFDKAPTIYEDGNQLRDYISIHDVVKANLLVLEREETNYNIYNVGGGKPITVKEFFKIVANEYKTNIQPKIPNEFRFGDTRHIISDITKLKNLGWNPENSIESNVHEYVQWLNSHSKIDDILKYAENNMKMSGVVRKIE